jgi:hypothetical protein
VERGGRIEDCLARYPGLAQELEPLLLTALGLQQVYDVGPRASFQRAARQRFLAAAASRRQLPLLVASPARRFSFGWRWAPAAVGAPALAGAIALAVVLGLSGGGGSPENGMTVTEIAPVPPPAVETPDIPQLVARLEEQLGQVQEQVATGAVIPNETIQELKDINQSLEQTLPGAPPEAAEATSQIAGLLDQQQQVLSEATEQNQVAPEAADDVNEVIRIAGDIQEQLALTATPTPTPAPTETPASSATATATPEASATPTGTPESSPGPGAAGGETIIPLTPTPSPVRAASPRLPDPLARRRPGAASPILRLTLLPRPS